MVNVYEIFTGEDLKVAERIKQRRLQLLVHSCIYYNLNSNIISDKKWDEWAKELLALQQQYPEIASKVDYADAFADWDASTGAFLPLDDEWVVAKANKLLGRSTTKAKPKSKPKTITQGSLF